MRQKHIDQDKHLCEHHDDVTESYPSDLIVLLFIIISLKPFHSFLICLAEYQNVADTLYDEKDDVLSASFPRRRTRDA